MARRAAAAALAACVAGLCIPGIRGGADVVKLTDDTFDQAVRKAPHFVKFFAPWCGHCKAMAASWTELAQSQSHSPIVIAEVDCTEHVGRCSEAEVDGYPTLKLFAGDSSPIEYTGGRSLTGFEHFVAEHSGRFKASGVAGSVTEDGLFQLADGSFTPAVQSGFTFVKFFAPWCGHCKAMQPAWVELARSYRHHADIKIAEVDCIANKATCSTAQIRGYPTLNLYFQGQELAKYKGGRTVDAFRAFLSEHTDRDGEATAGAGPPAGEEAWNPDQSDLVDLSDANFAPAVETGYWFVKFYAPWCGHCKRLAPVWQRVAAEAFPYTDGRVTIARVDCTESEAVCDAQGVSGYPALWLFKDGQKVAEYDGEREFDDIREYVASVIEDDADPAHDEL